MHVSCMMLCRLLPKSNHCWVQQRRRLKAHGLTPDMLVLHWQKIFETHKVPEARESSEIIISHALGGKTLHSIPPSVAQRPVSASQLEHIESMGQQRLNRVPVQYVIGEWDFLDMTLQMRPPVFIPRPETELCWIYTGEPTCQITCHLPLYDTDQLLSRWKKELVGLVLAESQGLKNSMKPRILEVGCGSGAVSLALLRHLPQSHVLAIDKTEAAVNLTRDNAERLGLQDKIHILQHDVMLDPPERLLSWGPVDAIVSNPPYIFTADMSQLEPEIFRYEDHNALDGGPDGMNVIQGILHLAPQLLKHGGDVFLEGDPRHPDMIHQWLQKNTGIHLRLISMVQDFCKKPRFVHLSKD